MSREMTWSDIRIFNYLPIPILIFNEKCKVVFVNNQAVNLYGYSKEEFKNLYMKDLKVPENEKQMVDVIMKYFFNEQKNHRIITKHKTKEESLIDVDIQTTILEMDNEIFLLECIREFTEQKEVLRTYERAVDIMSKVVKDLTEVEQMNF
ncbi:PAS domain S-box protein [Wukongibacter sp. M2B1]|uniref:PAS domain S-box protein n=1 Tax=Wukongibacter sp. M2B1 TaxID=3088895 RepID=UPI003D7AE679